MELNLSGKVVLITGSGQGLGKGIAREFLSENAKVVITDINKEVLEQTEREFLSKYKKENLYCFKGDLTNDMEISSCVNNVIDFFGRIDILVANLGSGSSVPDWNPSDTEWQKVMDLNFNGARRITEKVVPFMIKNNGGIITYISSIAGLEVIGAPIAYSVSKAAIITYSKNLSFKLSKNNIRVNSVCPGNIYFKEGTWDKKIQENASFVEEMLKETVPLNRFSTPNEIANFIIFLSSEKAAFITGSCLVIDGGQTISI